MASTCVKRTPSSDGNSKKFTWSGWVKRGQIGVSQHLWAVWYQNNSRYSYFQFNADDTLEVYSGEYSTSPTSNSIYLNTKAKFSDIFGWYHIVLRVDTDDSTQADRVRVYVNGVNQEFNASHSNGQTLPSSGTVTFFNKQYLHTLGRYANSGGFFSGIMSHVHWCDGYSYAPTEFGETDTTTGEWKIKTSPSVSYGTNGFFILKDGNSTTDQSGNSMSFTTEGTLTNTEDNPSNVFCTMNPFARYGGNLTYSNGNTNITGGSSWRMGSATLGASAGKYYYEYKITTLGSGNGYHKIGFISDQAFSTSASHGADPSLDGSYVFYCVNGELEVRTDNSVITGYDTSTLGISFSNNDIMCLAIDMDNKRAYFRKNDGAWIKSANPVSGTNGLDISADYSTGSTKAMIPAISIYESGAGAVNFGNGYFGTSAIASEGTNASGIGKFEFDVPTGYTALSTKGLNE